MSLNHEKSLSLITQLENTLDAFDSARELIHLNNSILISNENLINLKAIKKKYILDSFIISRFQKEFKEFQYDEKLETMDMKNFDYNKIVGEISRLNTKLDTSFTDFEKLSRQVKIPQFKISVETLTHLNDAELLKIAQNSISENTDKNVELNQLFSLKEDAVLPFIDYSRINKVINLEFRLRLRKRLNYELLTFLKNQLQYENKLWIQREQSLSEFLTKPLADTLTQVERIINESNKENDARAESEEEEDDDEDDYNARYKSNLDTEEDENKETTDHKMDTHEFIDDLNENAQDEAYFNTLKSDDEDREYSSVSNQDENMDDEDKKYDSDDDLNLN
ncbi:unnamed protein product [Candida verbasci]|uniref:Uncharacterized protein n=1 Tax=Candida verbasci TaxID=1227364 RepID=A0A9W4X8J4_9ASCO|nr:unnamed protein product [Candida verbasci]